MSHSMIEQQGWVTAVEGEGVRIATQRQSACGHCSVNRGCGVSLLSKVFNTQPQQLLLPNTIHAKVGDQVLLGTPPALLLRASITLYLLPLLVMVISAVTLTSMHSSDIEVVGGTLVGLLVGLFLARLLSQGSPGAQLLRVATPAARTVNLNLATGVKRDE